MTTVPPLSPAALKALEQDLRDLLPANATFWRKLSSPAQGGEGRTVVTAVATTDLKDMAASLDIFTPPRFTSDRPVFGPLIALIKTILARFGSLLLRFSYGRQATLNFHSWNVALAVHELQARVRDLEQRLEAAGRERK